MSICVWKRAFPESSFASGHSRMMTSALTSHLSFSLKYDGGLITATTHDLLTKQYDPGTAFLPVKYKDISHISCNSSRVNNGSNLSRKRVTQWRWNDLSLMLVVIWHWCRQQNETYNWTLLRKNSTKPFFPINLELHLKNTERWQETDYRAVVKTDNLTFLPQCEWSTTTDPTFLCSAVQ